MKSLIATFLLSLLLYTPQARTDDILRVATVPDNPPFMSLYDGQLTGYEYDLGNHICQRLDKVCRWIKVEPKQLISMLDTGQADIFLASVVKTTDSPILMSDIYFTSDNLIAMKADSPVFQRLDLDNLLTITSRSNSIDISQLHDDDLHAFRDLLVDTTIGFVRNTADIEVFKPLLYTQGTAILYTPDEESLQHSLLTNEIDIAINREISWTMLKQELAPHQLLILPIPLLFDAQAWSAVGIGDPDMLLLINTIIAEAYSDGVLTEFAARNGL